MAIPSIFIATLTMTATSTVVVRAPKVLASGNSLVTRNARLIGALGSTVGHSAKMAAACVDGVLTKAAV